LKKIEKSEIQKAERKVYGNLKKIVPLNEKFLADMPLPMRKKKEEKEITKDDLDKVIDTLDEKESKKELDEILDEMDKQDKKRRNN